MTVVAVSDATFAAEVLAADRPVVVDYWADWCAPCKQLTPVIEAFAAEYAGRVKFVSLDANAHTATPLAHGVINLPTVQAFRDGEMVAVLAGNVTKGKLRQMIEDLA